MTSATERATHAADELRALASTLRSTARTLVGVPATCSKVATRLEAVADDLMPNDVWPV